MPLHKDLTGTDLHAPGAHKTQHEDGGSDEISLTGLAGAPALGSATTAVTQSPGDNSTKVATTAYADAAAAAAAGTYTDEEAQDAVGAMIADTSTIDLTYTDATPELKADVKSNSIAYSLMQDVSAASKLLGRGDSGSGDPEEITLGTGLSMSGTTLNATGSGGAITAIAGTTVATDESTSSTSYTDLTTPGPSVTLTTGTEVYIDLSAFIYRASGTGNTGFVSVAVSGATTIAAADAQCIAAGGMVAGTTVTAGRRLKLTGLTPGSNTFTMKYKVDGATFNFVFRSIVVAAV